MSDLIVGLLYWAFLFVVALSYGASLSQAAIVSSVCTGAVILVAYLTAKII